MSLPDPTAPPLAPVSSTGSGFISLGGLWRRLGPWHGLAWPSFSCACLVSLAALLEVVAPAILGRLIDALIEQPGMPWVLVVAYAATLVFSVVFDRWSDLVEVTVAGRLMSQVQVRLLADQLLDVGTRPSLKPAERAARMMQAALASGELFRFGVVGPFRIALAVLATVGMASFISPALGLASLLWAMVLVAATVLMAPATGKLANDEQRARSEAAGHAADAIAQRAELRRLRARGAEVERGVSLAQTVRKRLYARTRYAELRLMAIGVLQAGFVGTVLLVALSQWREGMATPGDVAAVVGLALALMNNLIWAGQQVSQALAARGTLAGVLSEWAAPKRRIWFPGPAIDEPPPAGTPDRRSIRLSNLWHGPLRGLTVELDPGDHTGIVAPSDMRHTLFSLLAGETALKDGTMHWGDAPWDPVGVPEHRDEVVRIPAQPVLFDRSIGENIWMGVAAGKLPETMKGLLSFVEQLPHKWDTPAGKHGLRMSVAQRLRVAAARALVDPPAWLLIDEVPAGPEGEALLRDLLLAMPSETTMLVGLRKPVASDCVASVLVLAHGRVVEDGSPVDLLAHGRHYARWWEQQLRKGAQAGADGDAP